LGGSCVNNVNRTVLICSPPDGATVTSPVQLDAEVNDSATVTAIKIYVDGVSVWSGTLKHVSVSLPMSTGNHRITVKAWDSAGSFSATENITVSGSGGGGACPTPTTTRTVNLCSPANNATVTSPVHIDATAYSQSLSTMQVY